MPTLSETQVSSSPSALSLQQRVDLLSGAATFAAMSPAALEQIAAELEEISFAAGAVLMAEGEIGDRLYLIVEGTVEVSVKGQYSEIPLEVHRAGDVVGDIALLTPGGRRSATVTAQTDVRALGLDAADFQAVLAANPQAAEAFQASADTILKYKFLKQATPFTKLDPDHLHWLARCLHEISVPAGATIMAQGEMGDSCYLLVRGQVEVVIQDSAGQEKRLETHGPGRLFGETALLNGGPRTATVRAVEPSDLLSLDRDDLLKAMQADRTTGGRIIDLVQLRDRPRQAPGILVYTRTTSDGEPITTLKDPRRSKYFRLSPQGLFIWERLDGYHTLRDLSMEYMTTFKSFAPQVVSEVVMGLVNSGFAEGTHLSADNEAARKAESRTERVLQRAQNVVTHTWALKNLDPAMTRWYNRGIRLLYTWPAQLGLAIFALMGLYAFVVTAAQVGNHISSQAGGIGLLLFLIPANLISVLLHELGHAFTVKAFGREVNQGGVGWYWMSPIAYVDTSDIWLSSRWPRIAVSLAGPYVNVITAGISAVAAALVTDPLVTVVLWQFALVSYVAVLENLIPLLELDGYFILIDWLERPNLREHAFAWLRDELPRNWRSPAQLRAHWIELIYGISALVFMVFLAFVTMISYRTLIQGWIARILPPPVASAIGWVLGGAVVIIFAIGILNELRNARRRVAVS